MTETDNLKARVCRPVHYKPKDEVLSFAALASLGAGRVQNSEQNWQTRHQFSAGISQTSRPAMRQLLPFRVVWLPLNSGRIVLGASGYLA